MARERKIIFISLAIGFIVTFILSATKGYSESVQSGISNNIIRFHVLANSDDEYDQKLKLVVRDYILDELSDELNSKSNIEETRKFLTESFDRIKRLSKKVIEEKGYDYDVDVELKKNIYFPSRKYGDISIPAGNYEALQIKIGEAKGKNWWCVMFPPLCYVDITKTVVTDDTKQELKNILTDEEYDIVMSMGQDSLVPYKVKFKIVEWWQELNNLEKNE